MATHPARRSVAEFELTLARCNGNPTSEAIITAQGYKPEIDETEWLATEVVHSLNDGGLGRR